MPIDTEASNKRFPLRSQIRYLRPSFRILYSCSSKYSLTVFTGDSGGGGGSIMITSGLVFLGGSTCFSRTQ